MRLACFYKQRLSIRGKIADAKEGCNVENETSETCYWKITTKHLVLESGMEKVLSMLNNEH